MAPDLETLEVCEYVPKTDPRPCVITIPWLSYARVCVLEVLDDREDPYAICNHGQGVSLGHSPLYMQ